MTAIAASWISWYVGAGDRLRDPGLLRREDDLVERALLGRERAAHGIAPRHVGGVQPVLARRVVHDHLPACIVAIRVRVVEDDRVRPRADDRRVSHARGAAREAALDHGGLEDALVHARGARAPSRRGGLAPRALTASRRSRDLRRVLHEAHLADERRETSSAGSASVPAAASGCQPVSELLAELLVARVEVEERLRSREKRLRDSFWKSATGNAASARSLLRAVDAGAAAGPLLVRPVLRVDEENVTLSLGRRRPQDRDRVGLREAGEVPEVRVRPVGVPDLPGGSAGPAQDDDRVLRAASRRAPRGGRRTTPGPARAGRQWRRRTKARQEQRAASGRA